MTKNNTALAFDEAAEPTLADQYPELLASEVLYPLDETHPKIVAAKKRLDASQVLTRQRLLYSLS